MPQSEKRSADVMADERTAQVEALTRKVFGATPDRVAFPGGTHRDAFIVDVAGGLYVLAKREDERDAQLEAIVLKCLSPTGHVPGFVALEGRWLVQQCIPGQRLPILLDEEKRDDARVGLLSGALEALAVLQEAAHSEGLQHRVPRLGGRKGWIADRIGEAHRASAYLEIPRAAIDEDAIHRVLDVKYTDFIKWDSRPGNALVHEGRPYWFDWEDCGRRRALDDLACVLCDEWAMISPQAEDGLIETHLPRFARGLSADEAYHYLMVAGLVQISFRLRLALKYRQRDGRWWSRKRCLQGDKVGVTPQETARLCERGIRWAGRVPVLEPYTDWLNRIADILELGKGGGPKLHRDAAA